MANSTRSKARRKSTAKRKKPTPDFPLFHHASGRWCKKVRPIVGGKRREPQFHYFGRVDADPQGEAALDLWLAQKDHLLAGRKPPTEQESVEGFTVEDLCDHFLTAKDRKLASGEITSRTYADYKATCERIIKEFGRTRLVDDLRPADFESLRAKIAKQWGPVRLGNEVQRVRSVFKYAVDATLIEKTVKFGPEFKRPNKKVLRKARAAKGSRMIEADDVRRLLDTAGDSLKAMILLALNGGLGNSDIGNLPLAAINLARGWVNYPRPKTGIERRFPLWAETADALKVVLANRPAPKEEEAKGLVFVTKYGGSWAKDAADSPVSKEFRKLLDELKLHRPGLGFYSLRHVFETIAGGAKDQVAVNHVMGHADESMAAVYREHIDDDRLVAVAEHVRRWLFAKEPQQ